MGLYRNPSTGAKEFYWVTDGSGRELAAGVANGSLGGADRTDYLFNGGKFAGGSQNSNSFGSSRFESPIAPGFSSYRNRIYDQSTGRWTQEDPIGVAGGVNLYQFNGNNPVAYTDPFGLKECEQRGNCSQADGGEMEARGVAMRRADVIEPTEASPLFFIGGIQKVEGEAVSGVLKGFTKHGINQAISRDGVGVATEAILSAVKSPLKIVEQGGGKVMYIGENASVILNDAGKVLTTWARNSLGWRIKP